MNTQKTIETIKNHGTEISDFTITGNKYINFKIANYKIEIETITDRFGQNKLRISFTDFEAMNHIQNIIKIFEPCDKKFISSGIYYVIELECL